MTYNSICVVEEICMYQKGMCFVEIRVCLRVCVRMNMRMAKVDACVLSK